MTSDTDTSSVWSRLKELVDEALALSPADREAFLSEQCGADARLLSQVESLLALDPTVAAGESEGEDFPWVGARSWQGARLGAYRLLDQLGQGGMGAVYLAERVDGEFEHQVAIKVVGGGPLTQLTRQRFLLERQVLARLSHPNIAALLDGGTTEAGIPYLVMERIVGETILNYCMKRDHTLDQKLELFIKVCDTVDFAHRNLVIHRDLKPSNILVEPDGTPKLLDFGIAKLLDGADEGLTRADQMPGTVGYVSPEQLLGQSVTTAADVYSLGVVLYEMLTEQRPYGPTEGRLQAVAKAVQGERPTAPSKALRRRLTDTEGQSGPGLKVDELEGDLDRIMLKAVANEPGERYGTARELADDLRRFRRHEPVSVGGSGLLCRTRKLVRRHRGPVVAGALLLVSLVAGFIARSLEARRAEQERARAVAERARAEELASFMIQELWTELEPIGRLDVLAPVSDKLLSYYEERAVEGLSREQQQRYNDTLSAVAQVLTSSGDTAAGLEVTRRYVQGVEALHAFSDPSPGGAEARRAAAAGALMQLAIAHREVGDHAASASTFLEAADRLAMDVDLAQPTTSLAPVSESDFVRFHLLDELGVTLFDQGRLREALHAFQQAGQWLVPIEGPAAFADSTDPETNDRDAFARINLHLHLAAALLELEHLSMALGHIDRAVAWSTWVWQRQPDDIDNLLGLTLSRSVRASILRQLDRATEALAQYQESVPALEEAVRKDPANAEVRYQLGESLLGAAVCRHELGSGSAEDFERVLAASSPLAQTTGHVYLIDTHVRALLALGRADEAAPLARKLLDREWNHREFRELCAEHGITALVR